MCYNEVPKINDEKPVKLFYQNKKPCLYKDENLNTETYIQTTKLKCDPENVCNEFFCKKDNDKTNKCPITFLSSVKDYNSTNTSQPFLFSNGYIKYADYDSNYHGYVNAPVTDIILARNGMCNMKDNIFDSNYPLLKKKSCIQSSRYRTFDSTSLPFLLKLNNISKSQSASLPFFDNYTENEEWLLQAKTAFSYNSLYCILNKYKLFSENVFTINSHGKLEVLDKYEVRPAFNEKIFVFHNLINNLNFQNNSQNAILYLSLIITIIEVSYVLIKFFNICGDDFKFLLFICSYEGYFAFIVDIAILFISVISKATLSKFISAIEELENTKCLDGITKGKFNVYRVASEISADKNFEMFLVFHPRLLS